MPIDDVLNLALKNLRIAVAPTFPSLPVAADICHAVEELARQLNQFGAVVEEAVPPELDFPRISHTRVN